MATKNVPGIPRTATEAKKRGYKEVAKVKHADLSSAEKKKWALVKPSAATGPQTICYYDPNTGEYDDCHEG
jgi:hypothetical protein